MTRFALSLVTVLLGAGFSQAGIASRIVWDEGKPHVEVTLDGEPDPVTGMVFDLKRLKDTIQRAVIEPMDHRFLNHEVPPFDRVVPTAENIAADIWNRLAPYFREGRARLHNVRLYETEDLFVDYSEAR